MTWNFPSSLNPNCANSPLIFQFSNKFICVLQWIMWSAFQPLILTLKIDILTLNEDTIIQIKFFLFSFRNEDQILNVFATFETAGLLLIFFGNSGVLDDVKVENSSKLRKILKISPRLMEFLRVCHWKTVLAHSISINCNNFSPKFFLNELPLDSIKNLTFPPTGKRSATNNSF